MSAFCCKREQVLINKTDISLVPEILNRSHVSVYVDTKRPSSSNKRRSYSRKKCRLDNLDKCNVISGSAIAVHFIQNCVCVSTVRVKISLLSFRSHSKYLSLELIYIKSRQISFFKQKEWLL